MLVVFGVVLVAPFLFTTELLPINATAILMDPDHRTAKIPLAVLVLISVVALPALDVLPIMVSALASW